MSRDMIFQSLGLEGVKSRSSLEQGRSQKKIEGGPNFVTFKSDVIYFSNNAAYSPRNGENINFVEFLSSHKLIAKLC